MNVQTKTKFAGLAAGLLIFPAIAACTPQAQIPNTTQPAPEAVQPPLASPSAPIADADDNRVVDVVEANNSLSTLASAIDETQLDEVLNRDEPFTVFAPTNEAFAALPAQTRQRLLQPENRQKLAQILSYHVVPGQLAANQLSSGEVRTVEGANVNVQVDQAANQVRVNEATVVQADIPASNGVVHIVDRVILPPNFEI
ncbi:fasciclin domain-containing protein [Aliterella atlantica]|uniref:Beta-Ig-H3/fasciclin n=1 Tax=Aliterella atlantica CENA595 TaxID=1618023 RepID=A0A0D8ZKW7_9CYAN|nr:fasciclin domain-containing protein [Aliterella atlantica]KJH69375.1 beta-Ig-H3/fasciclin [Aliterella atlantica CENA595]